MQQHYEPGQPLTVAGPRRIRTGFPFSPQLEVHPGVCPIVASVHGVCTEALAIYHLPRQARKVRRCGARNIDPASGDNSVAFAVVERHMPHTSGRAGARETTQLYSLADVIRAADASGLQASEPRATEGPAATVTARAAGTARQGDAPAVAAATQHPAAALQGPRGSGAAMAPQLRKQIYRRVHAMLRSCQWAVLAPNVGLASLRGAPAEVSKPVLDAIEAKLPQLAADPAHGGTVSRASVEEAAVAVAGRLGGALSGAVRRENSGVSEFIGENSAVTWDVKSPVSPQDGEAWAFDAEHQVDVVRHDLQQGDLVLLNLSRCSVADARAVTRRLNANLTPSEREQVYVLAPSEAVDA